MKFVMCLYFKINLIDWDTAFLSFWDFYLFQLIFLLILMIKNQGSFRIFSSITYVTVQSQREGEQKDKISGQFFSFSDV